MLTNVSMVNKKQALYKPKYRCSLGGTAFEPLSGERLSLIR